MTTRRTSWIPLAVLGAALLGVGAWSIADRPTGLWDQQRTLDAAIEYHEALVGEVLRIDAGSRWSFDTLTALEIGLRGQIDRLESTPFRQESIDLPQALRGDLELVERYKTHHAVRRKSLAAVIEPGAEGTAFPESFRSRVPWLVLRLEDSRNVQRAVDEVEALLEDEVWLDPQHADARAHLQLIARSQTRCDAIVDRLVGSPVRGKMLLASDRLRARIESHTGGLESRQRLMLVLLAASLGYAGAMLVEQRRAVRDLAETNDGLEAAVAARTAELSAERELLRSLLDSLPSAVFWKDLEGVYRGSNPAFAGLFGFDDHERVVGMTDEGLPWDPDTRAGKIETERSVLSTHKPVIEKPVRKSLDTGRTYDMIASKTILRDHSGRARGLVGVYTDVTELNRLRGELAQAEKLRSVGQLAAGIAHEINSPIQTASGNIEYLRESLGALLSAAEQGVSAALSVEPGDGSRHLDNLRRHANGAIADSSEALRRVTEIVRAMRVMSHPGKQRYEATNLNALLESAVTLTRNRWKYAAELKIDADPDLPMPEVLTNEVSQVLLNLLVNAGDAIADSRDEDDDQLGLINVRTWAEADHVVVEVEDNGCGMPPDVRARVFEPFFTTKDVGEGTGQGLAIVHEVVVNGHGGEIECDSEPGVGTTFRVRLPIVAAAASSDVPTADSAAEQA